MSPSSSRDNSSSTSGGDGRVYGIARQQHPIAAEPLSGIRWNGRGNFSKQVGVGSDTAVEVFFHIHSVLEYFPVLPGQTAAGAGAVRVLSGIEMQAPGQLPRNLATRGIGTVFVPAEGAGTCPHPGQVTFFRLDTPDLIWPLAVIYRKGRYFGRLPQLLIDAVKMTLCDKKS